MINVAKSRAVLNAMTGDVVVIARTQLADLLAEVEIGQDARRSLVNIKTIVGIAASKSGAPA